MRQRFDVGQGGVFRTALAIKSRRLLDQAPSFERRALDLNLSNAFDGPPVQLMLDGSNVNLFFDAHGVGPQGDMERPPL